MSNTSASDNTGTSPGPTNGTTSDKRSRRAHKVVISALLICIAGALCILYAWKLPPFISRIKLTDDAYIRANMTMISPQVSGYVDEVDVHDFQVVRAGDILFHIDDETYRQRTEQAKATLAERIAALENYPQDEASKKAALRSRQAALDAANAQLVRARADMNRVGKLSTAGDLSVREKDAVLDTLKQSEAAVRQADAALESAGEDVKSVIVSHGQLIAAVASASAALHQTEIDLKHTVIRAPRDGQLGQVGTRLGQYVTSGTQLVSMVPTERWIIANFKERDTFAMVAGLKGWITVDGLDDRRFSVHISSLSPATGSEFAIIPSQNATGNFTKVAQRIPVKLVLDPDQGGLERLRPGMSVIAYVDTAGNTR